MRKLVWLFIAGGCGVLARYWLGGLVQRWTGGSFPWGTFAVNVAGCLAFGFVWSLAEQRLVISGETRFLLLTGFMGAFTTFSTYAFETSGLIRDTQWWLATGNLFGQMAVGLGALLLGMALGRLV